MEHFDVIVVGGGPAGATLATLLAQAKHRVLLLEKQVMPRYKVGESLLPATVRDLCDMLNIRKELQDAGFVEKRGATFSWGLNLKSLWSLNFGGPHSAMDPLPAEVPSAFNVPRATFDHLLINNAQCHGVIVRQQCSVTDFCREGEVVTGICYKDETGTSQTAKARFVADASGQRSKLARTFGKRTLSEFFKKVSIWGYFRNGKRLEQPFSGNVLFQTHNNAWVWYIPIDDELTSVGVVMPSDDFRAGDDPSAQMNEVIQACPLIADYLSLAEPATDGDYGQIRTCSEYSYSHSAYWQPGAILLGDAACFVDVLLSSGVHLATFGAVLAAQSINAVLQGTVPEHLAMNEYEARLRREYAIFYNGLVGLYDMCKTEEEYGNWLRDLLIGTSGMAYEADEPSGIQLDCHTLNSNSKRNVNVMRAFVQRQLLDTNGPSMTLPVVPELLPTLVSDGGLRTWLMSVKN